MAVRDSFDTDRGAGHRDGDPLHRSALLEASRALLGAALGLAAVLLPAALWRDIKPLYAEFGAAAFLLILAPLLLLILLYGRKDTPD